MNTYTCFEIDYRSHVVRTEKDVDSEPERRASGAEAVKESVIGKKYEQCNNQQSNT